MKKVVILAFSCLFSLFSCQLRAEDQDRELSGDWKMTLTHPDLGAVDLILSFDAKEDTFEAYTRKGADKIIVGGWTSFLGRTFTSSFKDGKLIAIDEGKHTKKDGKKELSGIFRSPIGNYYFAATIEAGVLQGTLKTKNQYVKGTVVGKKLEQPLPLVNYAQVFEEVVVQTEQNIFNKALVESKEWLGFKKKMTQVVPHLNDDLEMVFAFYYYASKLPFSHYALVRSNEKKTEIERDELAIEEKSVKFTVQGEGIGLLSIRDFSGTAEAMQLVFFEIEQQDIQHLIVDLRDNSGGGIEAGLTFVNQVATHPYYGGVFLTRKWFDQQQYPPTQAQRSRFISLAEGDATDLLSHIHRYPGVALSVQPAKKARYDGQLYVLVNQRTASTCEPIVHGLQLEDRAVVVGEKTAGAMLNSERFSLAHGFTLVLPTADYYTADGKRLDQVGVQPTRSIPSEEVLDYVLKELIGKSVKPKE
ncbi:S41 family peptidase [Myroides sp. C8-3]|uniref:S41 family peptidase n=1 Tax=Myroides sp. C8-3 TaxID=3400533 RepID=UPI003D2F80FC